jgi:uroporphyrinogen decarboxylase
MDPIFEDIIELGVDGMSIDAPSSLDKLFEVGRGKTAIIGNVDPILFIEGTQDQLRQAAKNCLDIARKDPGYVVGPGCQIPLQADLDNIRAFTQACHEYGTF